MMKLGLSGNALKVIAIVAILMIGRNRGDFSKQISWLGKFFYYYYPIHMALIGLLARIV